MGFSPAEKQRVLKRLAALEASVKIVEEKLEIYRADFYGVRDRLDRLQKGSRHDYPVAGQAEPPPVDAKPISKKPKAKAKAKGKLSAKQ